MLHRYSFLLILITLLAACGGQPAAPPTSVPAATDAVRSNEPTSAPTAAATIAAGAAAGDMRLITHAMGETRIPASPQRVVVLDTGELDHALALGVKPVGAPVAEAQEFQEYLADQLDGIADIGAIGEPDLEAILALKPDLILGSKQRYEEIYPQLSDIAPTVFVEALRVTWRQNFRLHAEALGKTAEAKTLLATYDARVTELQTALGAEPLLAIAPVATVPAVTSNDWQTVLRRAGNLIGREAKSESPLASWDERATTLQEQFRHAPPGEVSIVRYFNNSARYLPGRSSFAGQILDAAGVPRPPVQADGQGKPFVEVSLEEMSTLDGDVIFVLTVDEALRRRFEEQPLWQQLHAVQAGRVYAIDQHWFSGNILAAHAILDDLERYLLSE